MQGIRLSGMALSASAGAGAISLKGLTPSAGTGNVNAIGIYMEWLAATSKISTSSGLIHLEGTAAQTNAKGTIGSIGVWNAGYTIGGTTSVSQIEVIGDAGITRRQPRLIVQAFVTSEPTIPAQGVLLSGDTGALTRVRHPMAKTSV
jgi:hypothetical protein